MNVLLDANFIINLQHTSCVDVLVQVAKNNGWTIYLGTKVKSEATVKKPLNDSISHHIAKGVIILTSCFDDTFQNLKGKFNNLGDGELESIAIAYDCPSKLVNPYTILSDDTVAKNKAKILGIDFLGIISFFVLANKLGLLIKKKALDCVDLLKQNNFILKQRAYTKFVSVLI